ncbi:uncharacterized protein [Amphiura filiformis]|uniref:uncharacterized protein n=1 Tax=Amphiura filiformis TaxID=82378 RepID=UPI003B21624C
MKPKVDGSVKSAMFTLVEGLVFISLGIAVNHSFLGDVHHSDPYALGKMSLDILKIKTLFNNVSIAFFGFLVVASVLPPTAVRKNVPFFYAIYILIIMIVAVFMIAGIAVYTALYLNIKDYGTQTLSNTGKKVFENRYSGTMAMLIIYAVCFFFHCVCTAYSIYHYFTWRVNMQRWSYDMEPSAMYYHHGMVNASYMNDRPPPDGPVDPRCYWPPPPPGASGGPYRYPPPPWYHHQYPPPDEKPGSSSSSTHRSEAATNTESAASGATASTTAATGKTAAAASTAAEGATGGVSSTNSGEPTAATLTVQTEADTSNLLD